MSALLDTVEIVSGTRQAFAIQSFAETFEQMASSLDNIVYFGAAGWESGGLDLEAHFQEMKMLTASCETDILNRHVRYPVKNKCI